MAQDLTLATRRQKKDNLAFRRSEELLLICARKELDEQIKNRAVSLIKRGIDWDSFINAAIKGGIIALIFKALEVLKVSVGIPQPVFERLKKAYIFIFAKNVLRHKELTEILKLFSEKNIFVVPLKGTILAKRIYADIAARGISVDFDLLIKEEDKEKVYSILRQAGYSNAGSEYKNVLGYADFRKPKAAALDIHWYILTVIDCTKERLESFLDSARPVEENGVRYYEFCEEELLLYLSAHFISSDCLRQLRYLCDINELLDKYKGCIDWARIIKKAKRWKLSGSLYVTLKLCQELFGYAVPLDTLRKLRPNIFSRMLIKIFAKKNIILRPRQRMRRFMDRLMIFTLYRLIESRSFKDYFEVFFPPKEYIQTKNYALRTFKGILKLIGVTPE